MGDVLGFGNTVMLAEPLMLAAHDLSPDALIIKYGLKQHVNHLEDGQIDPDDAAADENTTKSMNEDELPKHSTTLGKTMRKKFNKKQFTRLQFDDKSRITKRKRRTRARTSRD